MSWRHLLRPIERSELAAFMHGRKTSRRLRARWCLDRACLFLRARRGSLRTLVILWYGAGVRLQSRVTWPDHKRNRVVRFIVEQKDGAR